jgi:hypothetical protein
MVGLDFQPLSDELPVTIHCVQSIAPDRSSMNHLQALPQMIHYRLRDQFQFREAMQSLKTFQRDRWIQPEVWRANHGAIQASSSSVGV